MPPTLDRWRGRCALPDGSGRAIYSAFKELGENAEPKEKAVITGDFDRIDDSDGCVFRKVHESGEILTIGVYTPTRRGR